MISLSVSANFECKPIDRLEKPQFSDYLSLIKRFANYDAEKRTWQVAPTNLPRLIEVAPRHGFTIVSHPPLDNLAAQERQIESVRERVTVSMLGQKISFKIGLCKRLPEFNEVFDNKSGILSGITEYDPSSQSRLTTSYSLAQEAMGALKARGFTILRGSSFDSAFQAWEAKEQGYLNQDPVISSLLADGMSLFQHQNKAVEFLEKNNGCGLLGICMGGGKSLVSLAFAAKHNLSVVVVCPKVVRRTWLQEAKKFFGWDGCELDAKTKTFPNVRILTVNYESLKKFASKISGYDLLVVDESHLCANPRASRSKLVTEFATGFKHRILLSGTAIKNKREEIWPQLQIVSPLEYQETSHLLDLSTGAFWHAIQRHFLSMPKSDVLKWLPKKTTRRHDVQVDDPTDLPESIEEIMIHKHLAAMSKIRATCEKIRDILDNSDDSILVGSEFKDSAKAIFEEFKSVSIYHDGEMTHEKREQAKSDFQAGKARVFVSTRQSLAVGATLTRASHVVLNDLPWTPADIMQFEDRTHRISQLNPVTVYWVVAANSEFDVRLIELISQKYEIQKAVTEGKQISKEERAMLEKPIKFTDLLKKSKEVEELW